MRVFAGWTDKTPVIDGRLDDKSWQHAGKITNFILNNGESLATHQTIVWILYDQENLYLAIKCLEQEMDKLKTTFSPEKHDQALWNDDCVEVFIDIGRTREYYYHIIINSKSAIYDASHMPDRLGRLWASNSRVKTYKGANFWTTEISIPFKSLGKTPKKGEIWGFNLTRERKGKEKENSCFSCTSGGFHAPSQFGDLLFLPSNGLGFDIVFWGNWGIGKNKVKFNLRNKSASLSKLEANIETFSDFDKKISSNKLNILLKPDESKESALDYFIRGSEKYLKFALRDNETLYYRARYPINPVGIKMLPQKAVLDLNISPELRQSTVVITLLDRRTMNPIKIKKIEPPVSNPVVFEIPEEVSEENCVFSIDFFGVSGDKAAHLKCRMDGFNEIFREQPVPLPSLTADEISRGYLLFTRPEPGDIFPTSIPERKETINCLDISAAPGECTAVNFALHALNNLKEIKVELDDLKSKNGDCIKRGVFDLRAVKCWPQRTGWGSKTFHVIPELLEKKEKVDIPKGRTQQYYLSIKVPDGAVSAEYISNVKITARNGQTKPLRIVLTVLPFKLQEPADIIWGLFLDPPRWKKYTDERLLEELKLIRKQGINSLNMYLFCCGNTHSYKDGKVTVNLGEYNRYMDAYKKAGFKEPFVLNIMHRDRVIKRWIPNAIGNDPMNYSDQAKNVYKQLINAIAREAEKNNWPRFVFHVVDEPTFGKKGQEVVRTMKVIKELGFETFCTCSSKFTREILDPYLDYRCYNNIGYGNFKTEEQTIQLRRETLEAGDKFWWYGSGCYVDRGIIEDGNIIANRYLSGFFLWRSGATGAWAWTFCRRRGDYFNDFDGKEKCIVYPGSKGEFFTPTLQWEGIREGINDYKYLYTLSLIIKKAKESGNSPKAIEAKRIEKKLTQMLTSMPWRHAFRNEYPSGAITNADINRYRRQVVTWILDLRD